MENIFDIMLTAETNTQIAIHYINKFENDKIQILFAHNHND